MQGDNKCDVSLQLKYFVNGKNNEYLSKVKAQLANFHTGTEKLKIDFSGLVHLQYKAFLMLF